ncbi:MAG TPA: Holliday junction branch migration protein RuvA [Rhodospirillaceae bacterium]|nr:MAG: Holliday junction DNA helicase RuvA [Alphaproteobacteria bacterium GWF2_58_20]HAU29060.1 Holliday junction branch migration protein RuvA [Rhodospirillaceae bacterium]
MIALLKGIIAEIGLSHLVVDVGGVGYLVYASAGTLRNVGGVDEAVRLMIETQVREDSISLYGFLSSEERDWFRILYGVQGVGARTALAILSALAPDQLAMAIAAEDKASITRADGVGPKLAARLITELKDKVSGMALPVVMGTSGKKGMSSGLPVSSGAAADAVSALVNLGYRRAEAFAAVMMARQELGEDADVSALIRRGLKELSA